MNNGQVDNNPADWFYAQHGPSFVGASNAGIFNLVLDGQRRRQNISLLASLAAPEVPRPACIPPFPSFKLMSRRRPRPSTSIRSFRPVCTTASAATRRCWQMEMCTMTCAAPVQAALTLPCSRLRKTARHPQSGNCSRPRLRSTAPTACPACTPECSGSLSKFIGGKEAFQAHLPAASFSHPGYRKNTRP